MSDITLYRLQACPFCERVVRALQDLDVSYHSRFVEPLHSRRTVVKRLTGTRTVPAIVDESTGATLAESANIVAYVERTYGNGDGGAASEGDAGAASEGDGTATAGDDGGADGERAETDGGA